MIEWLLFKLIQSVFRRRPEEPSTAEGYAGRALAWLNKGYYAKAIKDYDNALRIDPNQSWIVNSRGFAWHLQGFYDRDRLACEERALANYAEALRINPYDVSAMNNRAWLRATTKIEECRDGKEALKEALKACELSGWKVGGYLDTLSVAYAEIGEFEQAIHWQRKALEDPTYKKEDGRRAKVALKLFAKRRPFRE